MKAIPCIQFVRPFARERLSNLAVSDEAAAKWEREIAPLGLRLTAELIPMGSMQATGERSPEDQVCVTIENPEWGDYRLTIYPNIPDGRLAAREVEKMIIEFDKDTYDAWLQELMADED